MARRHRSYRRRRNPFGGSMNIIGVKVAGALAGGIAASALPNAVSPSLSSGWGGVGLAAVIAFGGSYLLRSMSPNISEGFLIGGALQTFSRASQILLKKNFVSFSLSGYGPMAFPIPTPAYQMAAAVPASAAVTKSVNPGAPATMGKWSPRGYKYAA
jgi:hypothetical protein